MVFLMQKKQIQYFYLKEHIDSIDILFLTLTYKYRGLVGNNKEKIIGTCQFIATHHLVAISHKEPKKA